MQIKRLKPVKYALIYTRINNTVEVKNMKKLMVSVLFSLMVTTLPVAAKGIVAVEKIQESEENTITPKVTLVKSGKTQGVEVSEHDNLELNDVLDTGNKVVILKTQDGSSWSLKEKTKFSITATAGKVIYNLIDGVAEYQAAEQAAEITVKISGKEYLISANGRVSFSYDDEMVTLKIIDGTVKFGNLVFDSNKTVKIDAQGNVNISKMRGIRG
jgi:hypothetical protein